MIEDILISGLLTVKNGEAFIENADDILEILYRDGPVRHLICPVKNDYFKEVKKNIIGIPSIFTEFKSEFGIVVAFYPIPSDEFKVRVTFQTKKYSTYNETNND